MLRWLQFGDLHACEGDDWASLALFERLVAEANAGFADRLDFAVLPGDNANHATPEQFRRVAETSRHLKTPLHVLPGDHDFEAGHLQDFRALLAPQALPRMEVIAGTPCLFLDIVSAGAGGPDFRVGREQTAWLRRTLGEIDSARGAVVFMHAFPGDLKEGCEEVASLFAQSGVRYVGTGHTHYNDVLNDGHVIYGATRSTGEIEEAEGEPGFSLSALDGDVLSWRFRAMGQPGPFVLITSPSDLRLVTDYTSRTQVPEGRVELRAEIFGSAASVTARLGSGEDVPMSRASEGHWRASFEGLSDGLHTAVVTAQDDHGAKDRDQIEILVRNARERPKRAPTLALGRDVHSVRFWPSHGIVGGRLGPNANGRKW